MFLHHTRSGLGFKLRIDLALDQHRLEYSGVARGPCALRQGIILRLLSTKTTEFEVKIGAKVRKKQKHIIYCSYFDTFLG